LSYPSTQTPFKQLASVSHVAVVLCGLQGCPSAMMLGQMPLAPASPPPIGHPPTRQRALPLHAWPTPTQLSGVHFCE
jgi:hypothetical protein